MAVESSPDNTAAMENIKALIKTNFGLEEATLTVKPMANTNNNKVYLVELSSPTTSPVPSLLHRPLTHPIPPGTSQLVVRRPKTNVSMEDSVRVRNEVAFLSLACEALGAVDGQASLCPRVYAWDDANLETQFIVEEFKYGEHISTEEVSAFSPADQTHIFTQIAKFVKALQTIKLPEGVMYGGLTFNDDGVISSTKSPIPCDGPFKTYTEFVKGMCVWQLEASERSKHLNGWTGTPKLRERLEAFFANGLDKVLEAIEEDKPTLTHADLGMGNLLFDRETKRLTAVIDFDFSHVGAPVSEYLFSFYDMDYLLTSSVEPNGPIRGFLLGGFPEGDEHKSIDSGTLGELQRARRLDAAFASQGVRRPSTISYAAAASDIWWFSQELCQAYWFIDGFLARKTPEQLESMVSSAAANLEKYLDGWGY